MDITKLNLYKGETITIVYEGDSAYNLTGDDENQPEDNPVFTLYIYLDSLNIANAQSGDIKKIESSVVESSYQEGQDDGYVHFFPDENKVSCIIPYKVTKEMKEGSYTAEFCYGNAVRSISKRNNAFALVSAASQLES